MAKKREISAGLGVKKIKDGDFDYQKMEQIIEEEYLKRNREVKYKRKKSFSPSSIGYGAGTCFAGETEFVTDEGIRTMADAVGEEVVVWTGHGRWGQGRDKSWSTSRGWKPATVRSFGVQPLMKITVERNGIRKEIYATREHRWIVETTKFPQTVTRESPQRATTSELMPGWRLWRDARVPSTSEMSNDGIRAGFVYGDGSCSSTWGTRKQGCRVTLHGDKDRELLYLFENDYGISEEFAHRGEDTEFMKNNRVPCRTVSGLPRSYKSEPDLSESHGYLKGWLAGYFAADGNIHSSGAASITSHKKKSLEAVRDVCAILGINCGTIIEYEVEKLGKVYTEYNITLNYRDLGEDFFLLSHHREYFDFSVTRSSVRASYPRWTVVSVEITDRVEEVFCVVEPETERFALADGILTMNCPRRWYLSFSGAEFDESADAVGIANMENGSAFHDRIQKLFTDAGIMAEEEKELIVEDPPIRGFIDAIAEIDGVRAVGEFKSTRDESFVHRRYSGNPMAYHLYQVLIYMYFEKIDQGFLFYENKNDQTFLTIPIRMNDYTRKIIEDAIEWMRKVHGNWKKDVIDEDEDGNPVVSYENLPTRPWTRRNKNCQQCPVFNECWENRPDGEVDLPPMEVVTL